MSELSIDRDADAIYIRLSEGAVAATASFDESRAIDVDETGRALGVEFLNVSHGVRLVGLPEQDRLSAFLASAEVRFSG